LEVATDPVTDTVWVSIHSGNEVGTPFTVGRIDPSSNTFETLFKGGGDILATLSGGEGTIWFTSNNGTVVRFDARTGRVVWQHKFGLLFTASCIGNGSAWLAWGTVSEDVNGQGAISGGAIAPIALATNEKGPTVSVGGGPSGMAVTGVAVYVSDFHGGVIAYVGGAVQSTIPASGSATGIVVGDGALWVPVNVP
jgi:outer membrane protein assembly factor BamB